MHPNEKIIREFYAAFARRDAVCMAACYHEKIIFSDPVFLWLEGIEAKMMWKLLCEQASDFELTLQDAAADDDGGSAHWQARYRYSQTGRMVHNHIHARFAFRDGSIVRHVDRFDLWRWSRQALGLLGTLLGWSWPLKALIRKKARAQLTRYMASTMAQYAASSGMPST